MKNDFGYADVELLVESTFKILSKNQDKNVSVELQFVCLFIKAMVESVLNDPGDVNASKRRQYEYMKDNFESMKRGIQNAVALAFQIPMQSFSKSDVEYYCQIRTIPDNHKSTAIN